MKSIVRAAFAAALMSSAVALLAPSPVFAADKASREVAKPLSDAQKAMTTGDYATALTDIKTAQAVTDRTPYDDYLINSFLAQVYVGQKDYASADAPMEAAADSPALPDEAKKGVYSNAFQLAIFAKHYQKAVVYGQYLQSINALDYKGASNMAVAYYFLKDNANAQKYAQLSIDGAKAAGAAPDENMMKIVMNGALEQKDNAGVQTSLENLAMQYNQADSWGKLADLTLTTKGIRDLDELYLLRFKLLIPDSMNGQDYLGLASIANLLGYATEAYNVLQKGIAAGKITTAQAGPTYAQAKNGAAQDERALGSIAASAEKSKTGEQDVKLAEDYWGYGRFADAEAAARRGIGKGGIKDPSEGQMILGMSLVAQGKYDDAVQALSQVHGGAPRVADAHLWTIYAQTQAKKAGGAAPAPAPAPAH
jgi:hypothetical protein